MTTEYSIDQRMKICCGGFSIPISKRKYVYIIGVASVSVCSVLFIVCIIILGLRSHLEDQIDDRIQQNNVDTSISDYENQSKEKLLVNYLIPVKYYFLPYNTRFIVIEWFHCHLIFLIDRAKAISSLYVDDWNTISYCGVTSRHSSSPKCEIT